jgi:hypothetical protein
MTVLAVATLKLPYALVFTLIISLPALVAATPMAMLLAALE